MQLQQLADINKNHIDAQISLRALLTDLRIQATKNGSSFAILVLQDKSKSMEAKFWDYDQNEGMFKNIQKGNIVEITAAVNEYQQKLQLIISKIAPVVDNDDLSKYIPSSNWNFDKMKNNLKEFYDRVQSKHIKELLDRLVFSDDYFTLFCEYPAAKSVHHNYYHGLLQHVLEVLNISYTTAKYKRLSRLQMDRLIAIAILHDWAKIIEYKKLPEVGITSRGSMLGHIFLGAHYALNIIETIENFPEEDALVIINGILGHHGTMEWGSPVLPKTIEAQIVHQADKMSGDSESILSFISEAKDKGTDFTGKLWNMGTDYYLN